MLICNAQGLCGSLTAVDRFARLVYRFAQRFRPDLAIEVRHSFESVGVRHHNGYVFARLHGFNLQECCHKRGVGFDVGTLASRAHSARAVKHAFYIDAHNCERNKSDVGQNGKSAAHARRYAEHFKSFFLRNRIQRAFAHRGGDKNMLFCRFFADCFFKYIVKYYELRKSFARFARFGNNVEIRRFDVYNVEKRRHAFGVDIALDVKFGGFAHFFGQLVVMQMQQRVKHANRSERRTAYAEHNKTRRLVAYRLTERVELVDFGFADKRRIRPLLPTLSAVFDNFLICRIVRFVCLVYFGLLNAVRADGRFHHIVVVEFEFHFSNLLKIFTHTL